MISKNNIKFLVDTNENKIEIKLFHLDSYICVKLNLNYETIP